MAWAGKPIVIMVRHHREAAIRFPARHAPSEVLTSNKAALTVSGEAVRLVRWLMVQADSLTRGPFHASIMADVAKEEITSFLPPDRALGRSAVAAKAADQFFNLLVKVNDML